MYQFRNSVSFFHNSKTKSSPSRQAVIIEAAASRHLPCQHSAASRDQSPLIVYCLKRNHNMISWQIPSASPELAFIHSLCMRHLLPCPLFLLIVLFCLRCESADYIFPVIRMAIRKPGLQNERNDSRNLRVSICLHAGCYCC